jgi:predicted DNA-binding transcriptional regulator AlpA
MLGVSRQRVTQLANEETFPEPEVELASGRVWSRAAIEKWAQKREQARHASEEGRTRGPKRGR